MFSRSPQEDALSEEKIAVVSRRLSRRWKLLQLLGATMIMLAVLIGLLNGSEPTVPVTLKFLLTLGIIVFLSGVVMQERGIVGSTAK